MISFPSISVYTSIIDTNIMGLVFIIITALLYIVGLILRAARLRKASRIIITVGSGFFVAYTSLTFIDIGEIIEKGTLLITDYIGFILFIVSVLIFIFTLGVTIKKR